MDNTLYHIWKRDAIAELFMSIRQNWEEDTLQLFARFYKRSYWENPHVENFLQNKEQDENNT